MVSQKQLSENTQITLKLGDVVKKYIERIANFLFSRNLKSIEVLILAVLLFGVYGGNLLSVEFQPDETFWIVSSTRFDEFLKGEFNSRIWTDVPLISFEVRPIPSYIVAIGQRVGGVSSASLPIYWDWSLPKEENISQGAMPSARVLWWSRLPMALLSVFSLLGTILLLAKAHSRIAAYLFALIGINEYFLLHLRRAMSEAPLLLFTVLVLYASFKLLTVLPENSMKKIILWSVIAGVLSGMAGQSKLTGLACAGIAILGTLILISRPTYFSQIPRGRTLLVVSFIVVCTSLLVFFASYPFFYRNTLHRVLTTFYIRGQIVEAQVNQYTDQTIQSNERHYILFQRIFRYPLGLRTNNTADSLFHWINFLMIVFGLSYSIKQIGMKMENQEFFIVLVLGTLVCAVPMLFVPFDWDRYYLYPIFFSCIFFSIGIGQLLFIGFHISKNNDENPMEWELIRG